MEASNAEVTLDGGRHFERLVQTIKASLASAISKKLLTLEEFQNIVKKAENIVNSRPLTYQRDDSRDIPLTPLQLAWGRDITLMPPLRQSGDPLDPDYDAKETRLQYITLRGEVWFVEIVFVGECEVFVCLCFFFFCFFFPLAAKLIRPENWASIL